MINYKLLKALCLTVALYPLASYSQPLLPAQQKAIINAQQGDIIRLDSVNLRSISNLPYQKTVLPGPKLIISDDPEYIRVPEAVALREKITPGNIRFYLYNVNGVKEPEKMDRKITAVIKNTGNKTMHLRMLKYASQKPTSNYFLAGKQGLADYLSAKSSPLVKSIPPGGSLPLDDQLEHQVVKYDELVHGFYEFSVDEPGEISVIQTSPEKSGTEALKTVTHILPPKSASGAGRGVYPVCNYSITSNQVIDTKDAPVSLIVADGKTDAWVTGTEGTTGQPAKLAGNYGVMYHVNLKWRSSKGRALALVVYNIRAEDSKWCNGMAASMQVGAGKFKAGVTQLPKKELVTKGDPDVILVQIFKPDARKQEQTLDFIFSPPGASCLPVPLVLIPIDLKE